MERLVRALSIRQPLPEAILTGAKTVEYRSRRTLIRERVYLYASKAVGPQTSTVYGFTKADALALPRGLIVGSIEIVGCFFDDLEDDEGEWGWQLARPRRYAKPIQPKGVPQPGFWRPRF